MTRKNSQWDYTHLSVSSVEKSAAIRDPDFTEKRM